MGFFDECIDCKKRYPACQDHCEYGMEGKKMLNERNEKIRKAKEAEQEKNCYIAKHYAKYKRK